MRFPRTRTILLAALVGGAMTVPVGTATAGDVLSGLEVRPTFERSVPEFEFGTERSCDPNETEYEVRSGGAPVTDVDLQVDVDDNGAIGTFSVPGLPAGSYEFVVNCSDPEFVVGDAFAFARLAVEKDVTGDVPADATFVVEVACDPDTGGEQEVGDPISETFEFGPEGGSDQVITYGPTTCTVTETDDGGASSSSVEGENVTFDEPIDEVSTVTNTFPAPEPTETEEPTEEPTEEVEDTTDEAEPAEPVEAEPDYTG